MAKKTSQNCVQDFFLCLGLFQLLGCIFTMSGCSESHQSALKDCSNNFASPALDERCSLVIRLNTFDEEDNRRTCAGVAVSLDRMLTVSHCFDENTFTVNVESVTGPINLKDVKLHPNVEAVSKDVYRNDLALARFERPIVSGEFTPLALGSVEVGSKVEFYGYGRSLSDDFSKPSPLRRGTMMVSAIDADFIYAKYEGVGDNTCFGDSGGPVFVRQDQKLKLVGIVSAGTHTDCAPGDTSIFINLRSAAAKDFLVSEGVFFDNR